MSNSLINASQLCNEIHADSSLMNAVVELPGLGLNITTLFILFT